MATRRSRYWRFASPSTLILALLLFPLPWIEMHCSDARSPTVLTRVGVPEELAKTIMPRETVAVMMSQSGWQAARGVFSRDPEWDKKLQKQKASDREGDQKDAQWWERFEREMSAAMQASWIMVAYPIAMMASVVSGVVMRLGRRRTIFLAFLILLALSLVGLQHVCEFPLVLAYRSLAWERLEEIVPTPEALEDDVRQHFRYTHWFWLSQSLTATSLCLVLAERWLKSRSVDVAWRD
jgi:hypothetical protein